MHEQHHPGRDRYTLSLGGVAAINTYVMAPAIDQEGINEAWDARLSGGRQVSPAEPAPELVRKLENLLARYFAPGRCGGTA